MARKTAVDLLTPAERSLRARVAAHTKWAKTPDPAAATSAARKAFTDRFERQVDPEGILPPAERARRAASAKSAYFAALAFRSARVRRARSRASAPDDEAVSAA